MNLTDSEIEKRKKNISSAFGGKTDEEKPKKASEVLRRDEPKKASEVLRDKGLDELSKRLTPVSEKADAANKKADAEHASKIEREIEEEKKKKGE